MSYRYLNSRKEYLRNPFFPKGRRRLTPGKQGRRAIIWFALLAVCAGWAYLFLGSSYFRIVRVDVFGEAEIKGAVAEAVETISRERLFGLIPRTNIFLFREDTAARRIKEKLLLQSIEIQKIYPNALSIKAKAKLPALRYNARRFKYTLDAIGTVIEKSAVETNASSTLETAADLYSNLPILDSGEDAEYEISEKIITETLVQFVRESFYGINRETGINISKFTIPKESPSTLTATAANGLEILLNIRTDIGEQIAKLKIALEGKSDKERQELKYVDLRFGDRIFMK